MSKQAFEQLAPFESERISDLDVAYGIAGGFIAGAGAWLATTLNQAEDAGLLSAHSGDMHVPVLNAEEIASNVAIGAGAGFALAAMAAWGIRKTYERIKYNRDRKNWIDYHVQAGARQLTDDKLADFINRAP